MAKTSKAQVNSGQISEAADTSMIIDNLAIASLLVRMSCVEFLEHYSQSKLDDL